LDKLNVLSKSKLRKQDNSAKTRNVVLKAETYLKLEKYKVELVKRRQSPKITYDDVINDLLENRLEKGSGSP